MRHFVNRWVVGCFVAAFLCIGGLPNGAHAASAVAYDARVAGDLNRTRFVLDVDRHFEIGVFALADPYRVIVDLPETVFNLPDGAGQAGKGLVSAFRFGLFAPGKSRIVLDATMPVRVDKAFVLEPVEGQPARLVVDLVLTDRETFLQDQAEARRLADQANRKVVKKGDREPVRRRKSDRPVIVIDPGHGGIDGGAKGSKGTVEKDVVLAFALKLADVIAKTDRFDVELTRTDDRFLSLDSRVAIARDQQADLFVSIHADALAQRSFRGATIYTLSDAASDAVAARIAENENRADVLAGVVPKDTSNDVADILLDLTRRETKSFSLQFAQALADGLRPATKLVKNPTRSAGFQVLRAPDIPSVLLELGYLSNKTDEKLLGSVEWRDKAAEAVAASIGSYFTQRVARRP